MPTAKGPGKTFRKARADRPRLDKDQAQRQGAITALAFTLLGGRDEALTFLNRTCEALKARPIDLAMNSNLGFLRVEALIHKLAGEAAGSGGR